MFLLDEGKANTHLTHLEELVLTQGPKGYDMARDFLLELLEELKGNVDSRVKTSVKWDGAPAIFAGINPENGKFFVGTKSIFNKEPKINYTPEDVQRNHGHAPGLVDKLNKALRYLPGLGIQKILQGDFMFDDEMISTIDVDGEPHYAFKPNTITYAAPVDSSLGKEIAESKFGIVFHTTYEGLDGGASFGADISGLNKVPGVWVDDAYFTDDTGTVTLTEDEEARVIELVAAADQVNDEIKAKKGYDNLPMDLLNMYINSEIKGGQFLEDPENSFEGFKNWYTGRLKIRIDKLKSEKGKTRATQKGQEMLSSFDERKEDISNLFRVSRLLFEAKNIFINKYNNAVYNTKHFIDDGSGDLVASNPEGYVAVDHIGNGVKFVDRLEFSKANFAVDKGAKFQQTEGLTVYWGSEGFSVTKTLLEWSRNLPSVENKNQELYENLLGGSPITSLVREANQVKIALAEAVNWALNEKEGQNTALYPGKFKPPHGGHFNVAKSVLEHPEVDRLIVFVSPKEHEGLTPEQSVNIWNIYREYLPGDVDIRIADITPVRSVYDYIDNEADVGEDLHLILGEKDIEGGRFKTAAGRREGVNVQEVPIPPQMGGVSATQMRRALVDNNDKAFIAGLPTELNDRDIDVIMNILGGELDEASGAGGGAGLGGSIQGFAGVVGSEKKKKRHPKNFITKEDKMVNEVMNYLLGISVG